MTNIRLEREMDAQVAIVGGGPAGCAAAYHLARAGVKVILIDRKEFPRDKVCGDFVGPVALKELKKLGIADLHEYKTSNVIRQAALYLDGEKLIQQAFPEVNDLPAHGRVIPRYVLDNLLFKAARNAGVAIIENSRITQYQEESELVRLSMASAEGTRSLFVRLLIGADGSESTVARLMRGHRPLKNDRIIALRTYFKEIEGPEDQADLYFGAESFPGYYWLFPTGNRTANVGIGMVLETIPPTKDRLRELLLELIGKDKSLRHRLRKATMTGPIVGWPLTTYNPRVPIIGDRVMLVGDAAGLINPLNGEGIQYALLSGRWAASVAISYLLRSSPGKATLEPYADAVSGELDYDMALANFVVQFIRNRSLNPIWLKILRIFTTRARIDPEYARIMGGILAGLLPASDAVSLKVIVSTLEQAGLTIGFDSFRNVVRGPKHLAGLGMAGTRKAFDIACQAVWHPVEFVKWSGGVGVATIDLIAEATKHTVRPRTDFAQGQNLTLHLSAAV